MKNYQISKTKSAFELITSRLVVAFGLGAAIITFFWFVGLPILIYHAKHIGLWVHLGLIALPLAIATSGLILAKSISYVKQKETIWFIILNIICAAIIMLTSIAYVSFVYFAGSEETQWPLQVLSKLVRVVCYMVICLLWVSSLHLLQIKKNMQPTIYTISKNNDISLLIFGCFLFVIYLLFLAAFLYVFYCGGIFKRIKELYEQTMQTICLSIGVLSIIQLLISCLIKKQNMKKNEIILLAILIIISFLFCAFINRIQFGFSEYEFVYLNAIFCLVPLVLTIPLFLKAKNR